MWLGICEQDRHVYSMVYLEGGKEKAGLESSLLHAPVYMSPVYVFTVLELRGRQAWQRKDMPSRQTVVGKRKTVTMTWHGEAGRGRQHGWKENCEGLSEGGRGGEREKQQAVSVILSRSFFAGGLGMAGVRQAQC